MVVLEREPIPAPVPGGAHVIVREAVEDDWRECGRICFEAFATLAIRHGFPPDFPTVEAASEPIRHLIEHPRIYGVVAEREGRILGSSFLDERSLISAIGPVSVDPTAQDDGVGRLLMGAMLDRVAARKAPGVRLVQIAYHNRSLCLYTKLGFDVRASFAALHGEPLGLTLPGYRVRRAYPDDMAACDALCTRVHGHDRSGELREAVAGGTARVVEHLGRITGYTAGICYWSHSVAETTRDLEALIGAAEDFGTPGFLVPLDNGDLLRWSLAHGLRVYFVTNLMTAGIYQEPRGAYMPSVGY
ncbi:MAG TPA: GNAT family N-acetyltransferase [Candidatus Baltobacteraceae bacterium]|nr:GNAT family N-acetyltransferase [Candidatus Baltobacteraceae bacterium]